MSRRRPVSRTGSVEQPVRRRDGTWAAKIRYFDGDGVRRCETVYGPSPSAAKDAARRRLHTRLQEAEQERVGLRVRPRERPPTLAEVALRAEREVLPLRQRPRQILQTLAHLANWWEPRFGQAPVDEIDAAKIRAVLAEMRAAGRTPAYCNRVLSALSVVLEAAVGWDYLERNPCRTPGLRQREGRKVPRYLTRTEAARLIRQAEDRWRPFFAFLLYTGARFGEARSLRWRDVDLERRAVHIRDPKSGHDRAIPLHPHLVELLAPAGPPDHLVFQGRARQPGHPDPVNDMVSRPHRALERALKAAGIRRHLSIHDLRHTFATLYLEAGGNVRRLQELLGHSTPTMTFRYLHVVDAGRAADIERLDFDD